MHWNEDRGQTPTVFSSVNHLPGHPFCGLGSTILSKIERNLNVKRIQQNIEVKSTGQWGQNNHQLGGASDLWDFNPMYDLKQCVLIVLEFAIKANSKTTSLYYQI